MLITRAELVVPVSVDASPALLFNCFGLKRRRERRCRRGERVIESGVANISLLLVSRGFLSILSALCDERFSRVGRFSRVEPFLYERRRGFGLVGGTIASFSGSK